MNIALSDKGAKLMKLCDLEGFKSLDAFLRQARKDTLCPGICMKKGCDFTTEVVPSETSAYCQACGSYSVMSARMISKSRGQS